MDEQNQPSCPYPPLEDQQYVSWPYFNQNPTGYPDGASMTTLNPQYSAQYQVRQGVPNNVAPGYNQSDPTQGSFTTTTYSSPLVHYPTQLVRYNGAAGSNQKIVHSNYNTSSMAGGGRQISQAHLYSTPQQSETSTPMNWAALQQLQQRSSGAHLTISQSNVGASTSHGPGGDNKRKRTSAEASTRANSDKRQCRNDSKVPKQESNDDEVVIIEEIPDDSDDNSDSDSDIDSDEDDEDDDPNGKGKKKARKGKKKKTKKKKKKDYIGRACERCGSKNQTCSFVKRLRSSIKKTERCDGCTHHNEECIHVQPDIPRGPWPGWAHCPRLLELLRQDDEKLLYRWCSQMLLKSHLTPPGFQGTNFDWLKADEAALTGKQWSLSAMSVAINSGKKRHLPETVTPSRGGDLPAFAGSSETMVLDPTKTQTKQKKEWTKRILQTKKEHKAEYDYTNEDGSCGTVMSTPPTRDQVDEYRLVLDTINRRVDAANDNFKATRDVERQIESDVVDDWFRKQQHPAPANTDSDQEVPLNQTMPTTGIDESGINFISAVDEETHRPQSSANPPIHEEPNMGFTDNVSIDPSFEAWLLSQGEPWAFLSDEDPGASSPLWNQPFDENDGQSDNRGSE